MAAPEEDAPRNELAWAARSALDSLPLKEREAVSLCCEQGFSQEAAAEVFSVSIRTVSNRVHRGLDKMQRILARQGYGAQTPLAIGAAMALLPLPPASPGLVEFMRRLAAQPALAEEYAGAALPQVLQAASRKTAASGLLLGAAIAGVAAVALLVWRLNASPPTSLPPQKTGRVSAAERIAPTVPPARFQRRWTFENGAPSDIEVKCGAWRWKPGPDGKGGAMSCDSKALLLLPVKLPARPLLLEIRTKQPPQFDGVFDAFWSDGVNILSRRRWPNRVNMSGCYNLTICYFLIGRYAFTVIQCPGRLFELGIAEYFQEYPGDRVAFGFADSGETRVEEINLRELAPEEITERLRDPQARIRELEKNGSMPFQTSRLRTFQEEFEAIGK